MDDKFKQTQLHDAGFMGPRAAFLFASVMGVLGGFLGSVVLVIGLNVLLGPENEVTNTWIGASIGGVIGVSLALSKVVHGNKEAHEAVQDAEWRRHLIKIRSEKP